MSTFTDVADLPEDHKMAIQDHVIETMVYLLTAHHNKSFEMNLKSVDQLSGLVHFYGHFESFEGLISGHSRSYQDNDGIAQQRKSFEKKSQISRSIFKIYKLLRMFWWTTKRPFVIIPRKQWCTN